jgi:hypothetical protein
MTQTVDDNLRKLGLPSVEERFRAEEIAEAASRKASPKKRASPKKLASPTKRAEAKLRGANVDEAVADTSSPVDAEVNMDEDFVAVTSTATDTPVVAVMHPAEASAPAVKIPSMVFADSSVVAALDDNGILLAPIKNSHFYIYQFNESVKSVVDTLKGNMNLKSGTGGLKKGQKGRGPNAVTIQSEVMGKGLPHVAVYSEMWQKGFKIGKYL